MSLLFVFYAWRSKNSPGNCSASVISCSCGYCLSQRWQGRPDDVTPRLPTYSTPLALVRQEADAVDDRTTNRQIFRTVVHSIWCVLMHCKATWLYNSKTHVYRCPYLHSLGALKQNSNQCNRYISHTSTAADDKLFDVLTTASRDVAKSKSDVRVCCVTPGSLSFHVRISVKPPNHTQPSYRQISSNNASKQYTRTRTTCMSCTSCWLSPLGYVRTCIQEVHRSWNPICTVLF